MSKNNSRDHSRIDPHQFEAPQDMVSHEHEVDFDSPEEEKLGFTFQGKRGQAGTTRRQSSKRSDKPLDDK